MPAIGSPPRSSATRSGCISGSRSGCVWWRSCWPPAASSSATKPCDSGRANSASSSPTGSVVASRASATKGRRQRSQNASPARSRNRSSTAPAARVLTGDIRFYQVLDLGNSARIELVPLGEGAQRSRWRHPDAGLHYLRHRSTGCGRVCRGTAAGATGRCRRTQPIAQSAD
jgi:hypothetical protein